MICLNNSSLNYSHLVMMVNYYMAIILYNEFDPALYFIYIFYSINSSSHLYSYLIMVNDFSIAHITVASYLLISN